MTEAVSFLGSPTQRTAAALLSRSFAYDADVLPISYDGASLTVAVASESVELIDRVRQLTRKEIRTVVLPVREIREALKALYPAVTVRDADSQAAQTLDEIFSAAISNYASDVHIEPTDARAGRVRLDVDGVLQHERSLEGGLFERVVSLVKVRSNMNTGESRMPQDGRLSVTFDGRSFDVRTSTIPVGGLEKVVLRFLQRFDLVPDLEQLGMGSELLARYQKGLKRPGSFCVIAGPTGSGKSTTSYASLQTISLDQANVCSVEDPIECRIPGVAQIAVNEKAGITFPIALRALLRQNPHQLFIGELRDTETVGIALQASLTGISLITTLHARDALRVSARLAEFGANRSTLASSLTLAVSQRLVRMLCRRCKIKTSVSSQALAVARRYGFALGTDAWDAQGCEACSFSGFQGRIGSFEVLEIKPELAAAIERGDTPTQLGKIAFNVGYKPMVVDALRHVASDRRAKAKFYVIYPTTTRSSEGHDMLADIEEAIRVTRESVHAASTSDLHIEGNEPPWHRVDGAMQRMDLPVTEPESVRAFCEAYLSKKEYERLNGPHGAADGAIQHPSFGSIRIHAFRGENGLALSLRLLRDGVPDLASLGLPAIVSTFADFATGLVLFTGPTGSGKSTALAGLVNEINKKYERHIVTVEDPIEYRHRSKKSLIRQREVGRDVSSYGESLRGVLRADPDVILIGELRDPEVMSACLAASETGHLVFSTLHTSEAAETVQRIVGVFDGGRQEQARMQLAQSLQAIVSMRLIPDASGRGRRPACEIALNNSAIRSQLMSPEKTIQIRNTIETSRKDGMQTLEMDLTRMVNERLITHEAAIAASDYPDQIRVTAGIR